MEHPGRSVVAYYAKATAGVALIAGLLWAAWTVRQVLLLVLIAFILAIGLDPGVRFFERKLKMKRGLATGAIMITVLVSLSLFLAMIVPPIVSEFQTFVEQFPTYLEDLQRSDGPLARLEEQFDLAERAEELSNDLPRLAQSSASTLLGFTRRVGGALFSFLTLVVLLIYFMASLPRLENGLALLFPPAKRKEYRALMDRATAKIGGYVSGQLTVCLVAGASAFIAYLIIGLPFPAALAMLVAITTLIPSVGGLIGSVISITVALFDGFGKAFATFAYVLIYQQVENYVISPRIMKQAVDLSPAAVLISVLLGGSLLGFVGALLALPIAAAAKVVVHELWLRDRSEEPRKRRSAAPRRKRPAAKPVEAKAGSGES